MYAAIPDPQIEFTPPPGSDPEGNAEAEATIDTVAHETLEAMTDPDGTVWMDPNGLETADKCENGPQLGTALGCAVTTWPASSQVIDGHQYLIQDIWSNTRSGCVQSSTAVASIPALHTVSLAAAVQLVGERHSRQRSSGAGGGHPRARRRCRFRWPSRRKISRADEAGAR